jgi:hypothetical protein
MALKAYSFADMLDLGGASEVSGDRDRNAPVHAGLADLTLSNPMTPLGRTRSDYGDAANSAGDTETAYPCGFQDLAPTDPTVPTVLRGLPRYAGNDCGTAPETFVSGAPTTFDADRWCWPNSDAMNTREIEVFHLRFDHFMSRGETAAEALADKLVQRNRDADDRRLCIECRYCNPGLRCSRRMAVLDVLQRCDHFQTHPHLEGSFS